MRLLKRLNVLVYRPCRDRLHLQIADDRIDVVLNQRAAVAVHRHAPALFSVERHKVRKEFPHRLFARRNERPLIRLIFDLCLSLLRRFLGFKTLPLLLGFTLVIHIVVYDRILLSAFHDRCHMVSSRL